MSSTELDEIEKAKNEYFSSIARKNLIDNNHIENMDLDYVGISLNSQQIKLLLLSKNGNEFSYNNYKSTLLDKYSLYTDFGKRNMYLSILRDLKNNKNVTGTTLEVIKKLYEETKNNINIKSSEIEKILGKIFVKLPENMQHIFYDRLNNFSMVAYNGIKEENYSDVRKLYDNIINDYSCISLFDAVRYSDFQNNNNIFENEAFREMLDFCYDNDKFVRINNLLTLDDFPRYLSKLSKDILKQRYINYVDKLTNYIGSYNTLNKRMDRKPVIVSLDVLDCIIDDKTKKIKKSSWFKYFDINDLCDILKIARNNLKNVNFVYTEDLLCKEKRNEFENLIKEIKLYEKNNKIKLIDSIGIKLDVNLDTSLEEISSLFDYLLKFKMPINITSFEVCATVDMIFNNTKEQIEILRERYIGDVCNLINNYLFNKKIEIYALTYSCVSDKNSLLLDDINDERIKNKESCLLTLYSGFYDSKMNKKYDNSDRTLKKLKPITVNEKGVADTIYIWIILILLIVTICIVCILFKKFM